MDINNIGFENFRVFQDKRAFELAPITILTGANSSGKSTVIKGLKLSKDFWEQKGYGNILRFEEGTHQLGNFNLSISKHTEKKTFTISNGRYYSLLGNIKVENIFELDDSNTIENGRLIETIVKIENEQIIKVQIDYNRCAGCGE